MLYFLRYQDQLRFNNSVSKLGLYTRNWEFGLDNCAIESIHNTETELEASTNCLRGYYLRDLV